MSVYLIYCIFTYEILLYLITLWYLFYSKVYVPWFINHSFTHWNREKKCTISRMAFEMQLYEWKCLNFELNFTEICFKGAIDNIPALVQIMACNWLDDKPSYEPMVIFLLTHTCVTRPQWVMKLIMWIQSKTIMIHITVDTMYMQFLCKQRKVSYE